MIEEFDRDGDGLIDEEEFLAIIKPSIVWSFLIFVLQLWLLYRDKEKLKKCNQSS